MTTSPTQLTLKKLRSEGYICAITEHWNSFAKIRQDLFGFGDILAIREGLEPLIVQCTTKSNVSARKSKIDNIDIADIWVSTNGLIQVWGWYKEKGKWKVDIWEYWMSKNWVKMEVND